MRYRSRVPRAPVSWSVDVVWHYAGAAIGCGSEWTVADGRSELVVNLRDEPTRVRDGAGGGTERLAGIALCGPRTAPYELDVAGPYELMGAVFRPGGVPSATGVAADELFGRWIGAQDIWGRHASWLYDRLRTATSVAARLEVLEDALATWLARRAPAKTHPAVVHAIGVLEDAARVHTVRSLHAELTIGGRHFTQLFREAVGMPPKRFARVQRFQRALAALDAVSEPDWPQLALDAGYHDQPHMAREFREFAGLSPTRYGQARARHRAHVPREVLPFHTICGVAHHGTLG